jgi:hypothetical protein
VGFHPKGKISKLFFIASILPAFWGIEAPFSYLNKIFNLDYSQIIQVNLLFSGSDRFFLRKMRDTNRFKKIVLCPGFLINVN